MSTGKRVAGVMAVGLVWGAFAIGPAMALHAEISDRVIADSVGDVLTVTDTNHDGRFVSAPWKTTVSGSTLLLEGDAAGSTATATIPGLTEIRACYSNSFPRPMTCTGWINK